MSVAVPMTRETTQVTCPDCGGTRQISVRQRRRIMNGLDKTLLCPICRTITAPAPVKPSHRKYWTDRYSMDWIRETALAIWDDEE